MIDLNTKFNIIISYIMFNAIDPYLFNYIFSFNLSDNKCVFNVHDKQLYYNLLITNRDLYNAIKKECSFFFTYNPVYNLKSIHECCNHCDKTNNKIYIINLLNNIKTKKRNYVGEIEIKSKEDSNFILPYLKDLELRVIVHDIRNSIFLIGRNERFSTIF